MTQARDNLRQVRLLKVGERFQDAQGRVYEKIGIDIHNSVMAETDPVKACCTGCHGEHRLSHRTRKWDKTTGELIKDDGVRMTTGEMLERE